MLPTIKCAMKLAFPMTKNSAQRQLFMAAGSGLESLQWYDC